MTYTATAPTDTAYIVMAYIVMAYIVMAKVPRGLGRNPDRRGPEASQRHTLVAATGPDIAMEAITK